MPEGLRLDASQVRPMYRELLAIDLPTVIRLAAADSIDIRLARYAVEQSQGRLESTIGGAFPVLVPTALFEHVEGSVRATEGNIVGVGFNTFQPFIAIQWITNPGRIGYEILASKKRLQASQASEHAVQIETLRTAAVQLYDLVFAQARISTAFQAVQEAEELYRITQSRVRAGAGVRADELRAAASLAERRQDLTVAMNLLYRASLVLTDTLQFEDPTVTLIPKMDSLPPIELIRDDVSVERLLAIAVEHRPDLQSLRDLVDAAAADQGATWWGAFGPQFGVGYQYGGITGHSDNTDKATGIPPGLIVNPLSDDGSFSSNPVINSLIREGIARGSRRLEGNSDQTFSFSDQQRFDAAVRSRLSLSAIGDLKASGAVRNQVIVEAQRLFTRVKTQVVGAQQDGLMNRQLIGLAAQQTTSAEEALRLSQANLQAGTMTTLDVLQAQDALAQARLRHAEAIVRYNQSQVNLVAAMGLLDEAVLIDDSWTAPPPPD
jgi:outer membrane protein TolC